jgi:hypothetical protein
MPPALPIPDISGLGFPVAPMSVTFSFAGDSCICGTGLTTICASGGCHVLRSWPTGVPSPVGGCSQLGFSCAFGGRGFGGDVNTRGASPRSLTVGSSAPLQNYLLCGGIPILNSTGCQAFSGGGAGGLLGPGKQDSDGFSFTGGRSPGGGQPPTAPRSTDNAGLFGMGAFRELSRGKTPPASLCMGYECIMPGESGFVGQYTFDRKHFSLAKTLLTAGGGGGIECNYGCAGENNYIGIDGGIGGGVTQACYFETCICNCVRNCGSCVTAFGTGSKASYINSPNSTFLHCSNATYGGGGHSVTVGTPVYSCCNATLGAPGIGFIEYWTTN